MSLFAWLFNLLIQIAIMVIIAQAIMSWLINFNVINTSQPFVAMIWEALRRGTDPIYRPIRRFMPNLGGLDITPMVVVIGLLFLQKLINTYLI